MAKAFLSHSSEDKYLVEKIAKQLGSNNCHYDNLTFEAGKEALDEIVDSLNSSEVFVLFLSESALSSTWVKKEMAHASRLHKHLGISSIFPLIIDNKIKHDDARIPDWIKRPYNIKPFTNEVLILKKLRQFLREAEIKNHTHLQRLSEFHIGRHELLRKFEKDIYNLDNKKPTCIIASSIFEGIGRRSFLTKALREANLIKPFYDPFTITLEANESIENLIIKLSLISNHEEALDYDFTRKTIKEKVKIAHDVVQYFCRNNEIIFILDEGGIVLPKSDLAPWFKGLLISLKTLNQVALCVISKHNPYAPNLKNIKGLQTYRIVELNKQDIQTLFIKYLSIYEVNISPQDAQFFLGHLKGIPGQIIYAADLIKKFSVEEAKTYISDIKEFDELMALSVLNYINKIDESGLTEQIIIALSRFELISLDLVYKIFGEEDSVIMALRQLFSLSILYQFNSTDGYLKLSSTVANYIRRSKVELNTEHERKIKEVSMKLISKPLELNEESDYSEFLLSLKTMVQQNMKIPSKFLIPSLLLKALIEEYTSRNYEKVINLAHSLLENEERFDYQIIRETKKWLCLSLCRKGDERFFDEVRFFYTDYYEDQVEAEFLKGFFFRNKHDIETAKKHYFKVLKHSPDHSSTKRELVIVYLTNQQYEEAITWAKDNYENFKSNILHIHAYFSCLIKVRTQEKDTIPILKELIRMAERSKYHKATDFKNQMYAEFAYYIEGQTDKAIKILEGEIRKNPAHIQLRNSLVEIYRKENMYLKLNVELAQIAKYKNIKS